MRLVSALFDEFYPFDSFKSFNSYVVSRNPADLKEGDVLLVWGGADIYSGYYNKKLSKMGHSSTSPSYRDAVEWSMMNQAKRLELPIIGVCRGAQMLCALAGGYLMQHITGHSGVHEVVTNDGRKYKTNSIHHQMMVPHNTNHEVLAAIAPGSLLSSVYWDENTTVDHNQEPEFIYFNDVKGFAIQWHPEMMSSTCDATKHIEEVFENKLCLSQV